MEFIFLGGAMEIGASCIYVKAGGKRLLLDSGIRQSGTKDPLPDFRTIQEQGGLDAIIVSHAHMDHIGTLPVISKAYPNARIYMTVMTAELTRVLLYDSLKIMAYREDEIPHYTEQDVLDMLGRVTPMRYGTFNLGRCPSDLIPGGAYRRGSVCLPCHAGGDFVLFRGFCRIFTAHDRRNPYTEASSGCCHCRNDLWKSASCKQAGGGAAACGAGA